MEGINKSLFEQIQKDIGLLKYSHDYPLGENIIKFFELEADDYEERQNLASSISSEILQPHSKQHLPGIANRLSNLERNLQDIQPYQRDHICHTLLTFLLGFAIIINLKLEKKYRDFLFQWKLAGLLHDVGYPLEITDNLNKDFFSNYDKNVLNVKSEFSPIAGNYLRKYLKLYTCHSTQNRDTLDTIRMRLSNWKLNIDPKKLFNDMIDGKKFDCDDKRTDHGITSAILVMKAIDKLYEQANPKQKVNDTGWSFENIEFHITNACSSIFIHNLNLKNLQWDFNSIPLATLLKLCDELQDWGRPKKDNKKGELPTDYNFKIEDNMLTFFVKKEKKKDFMNRINKVKNFPIKINDL